MTTPLFAGKLTAFTSDPFTSQGRYATLIAKGVWGGALITVEASPDDGTNWVPTAAQLTANGAINFIAGKGVLYRVTLSNESGSTNLSAWVAYES